MNTEIIVVKQIPVIVERLEQIKAEVTEKVEIAKSLVCTDETVKAVKKARADLNNDFKSWEEKRKEVKAAVMTPYEQFETVYKNCITDVFKNADKELKEKIDTVENELKQKKSREVLDYFNEYLCAAENNTDAQLFEFINFERANINVTLSASLKSLKEQAKAFIDRVCEDLNLIGTQEHKAEILVEYKKTLNVSNAITSVTARLKAIEEEKARQEAAAAKRAEMEQQEKTQSIKHTPPVEAPKLEEKEEEFTLSFKVTATKSKLRQLKTFLDNGGFKYE